MNDLSRHRTDNIPDMLALSDLVGMIDTGNKDSRGLRIDKRDLAVGGRDDAD